MSRSCFAGLGATHRRCLRSDSHVISEDCEDRELLLSFFPFRGGDQFSGQKLNNPVRLLTSIYVGMICTIEYIEIILNMHMDTAYTYTFFRTCRTAIPQVVGGILQTARARNLVWCWLWQSSTVTIWTDQLLIQWNPSALSQFRHWRLCMALLETTWLWDSQWE